MITGVAGFQGELAALAAASLWAVAAMLYSRAGRVIPPMEMNLVKGVVASALLGLTMVVTGAGLEWGASPALAWLLVSGAVGIGLGDTAYFEALVRLGPRRALLLGILAPPLTGLIALLALGETLTPGAWLGIALTVAGVGWVITEREAGAPQGQARLLPGLAFGLLAALCQAAGAVMSHAALVESDISPLWSALLRMSAGLVVVGLTLLAGRRAVGRWLVGEDAARAGGRGVWRPLLLAIFLGTYLGIWLSQVSFKFAPAGVAQALLSTSPLFVLPLTALTGDRISVRAVLGVLVALGGIVLLFGQDF